ncbi:MAG TPA: VOC family protein [Kofleriaceae bacterium]|nr:VOC family protein [Kofleriaceae bacterium]
MPLDPQPWYEKLGSASATRAPGGLLGGLLLGIDHVGICVADMTAAGAGWAGLLGVPLTDREDVAAQKTAAGFLRMPQGAAAVELVCPLPGNAGLDRFLAQRGDALHHVAFAVSDIAAALERLAAASVELIDRAPRPGAGGHLVAFLHPRALGGTLVELVQRKH